MKKQTPKKSPFQAYYTTYEKRAKIIAQYRGAELGAQLVSDLRNTTPSKLEDKIRIKRMELKTSNPVKYKKMKYSDQRIAEMIAREETTVNTKKQVDKIMEAYENAKKLAEEHGVEFKMKKPNKRALELGASKKEQWYNKLDSLLELIGVPINIDTEIYGSP